MEHDRCTAQSKTPNASCGLCGLCSTRRALAQEHTHTHADADHVEGLVAEAVASAIAPLCEEMKAMASALELASKAIERISTSGAGGASKQETE